MSAFSYFQVQRLNEAQVHLDKMMPQTHPMTCPNRDEPGHVDLGGDAGLLVAIPMGWVCPYCDYMQERGPKDDALINVIDPDKQDPELSQRCQIVADDYRDFYKKLKQSTPSDEYLRVSHFCSLSAITLMIACVNRRLLELEGILVIEDGSINLSGSWIDCDAALPDAEEAVEILMQAPDIEDPLHPGFGSGYWIEFSFLLPDSELFQCELNEAGLVMYWRSANAIGDIPDNV